MQVSGESTTHHEHQWSYPGELQIDACGHLSYHRQEWCYLCGTQRVMFRHTGWSYTIPECSREMLENAEIKHSYISEPPMSVHPKKKPKGRLGRGLKELQEANRGSSPIRGLFPSKKP